MEKAGEVASRAGPHKSRGSPRLHIQRRIRGGHGGGPRRPSPWQVVRHDCRRRPGRGRDGGGRPPFAGADAPFSFAAGLPRAPFAALPSSVTALKIVFPLPRGPVWKREGG